MRLRYWRATGILCMLLVACLAGAPVIAAAEPRDDLGTVVEQSSLPREQKVSLLRQGAAADKAGLPRDDVSAIVKRGVARGWNGKAIEDSLALVIRTKEQGLPVRPVIDRILQGISKGVGVEKTMAAATKLRETLSVGDKLVTNLEKKGLKSARPEDRGALVQTVAHALERTIPQETIQNLGAKVAQTDRLIPRYDSALTTMTSFVEMGMPADQSARLMDKAIDKGYSAKDMVLMEREMSSALREGWKMDDAMKTMDEMVSRGDMREWHRSMDMGKTPGSGTGAMSPGGVMPGGKMGPGGHHGMH